MLHGDEYINRKNFASINVQATCNAKEWITSVDASWPGSVHDSRIFKTSSIYRTLQALSSVATTVLLADSGYGAAPWVLVPYKDPVSQIQKQFNRVYAKERVIIERVFGQLKRRFPALHYGLRVKLERVSEMIIACCILHNLAKHLNDADDFPEVENEERPVFDGTEEADAVIRRKGQIVRDEIATVLYNCSS